MQIATSPQVQSTAFPLPQPAHAPASGLHPRHLFLKHALDVVLVSALIVLGIALLIGIALLVRLTSRGPVFFRQTRVGYGGHEFTLYKFRTMRVSGDTCHRDYIRDWIRNGEAARQSNGSFKLEDDPRVTPIGRWLRKFSLDELPQLFNVLLGDMSLVGPRPAIPYEVEEYRPWHRQRLGTLPGITGLWQVSGRNRLSFDRMVELDIAYIQNWNLSTDLAILLKTIPVVLLGTGR